MPSSASTADKIRVLRLVQRVAPRSSYELTPDGARFTVPGDDAPTVRDRLVEAGLLDEPSPALVPSMSTTDWVVAAVLSLIAIAVRLNGVGPSSLWLDDAWVGLSARLPWSAIQEVGLTSIGFTSMVKVVGGVFGPSSFAFQALPLFFGVATPVLAVVVLRRWVGRWPAALIGLMTALSPISVTFSTRVKQYSFDAFCTVALLALALAVLERPSDRRRWVRFVIASTAAAVGSSILLVVVAASCVTIGSAVLIRQRTALTETIRWGAALAAFTLLYWTFVLGENVNPSVRRYWAARYVRTDGGAARFFDDLRKNLDLAFDAAVPLPSPAWSWLLFGAALATLLLRRWVIAVLCVMPLLITIVLSTLELAPLGGGRTDTHLMTALFLMTGFAINEWAAMASKPLALKPTILVAGAAIGLTIPTLLSISEALPYPEEDIRPLVGELESNRAEGDHVLLYYASVWPYAIYADVDVELAASDPDLRLSLYNVSFDDDLTILGNRRGDPEGYRTFVAEAVATGERVWFISSHSRVDDLDAVASAFLSEGYTLEHVTKTAGAELTLWSPPA